MSDKFTGRWLVTEYVHNPDGSFAGIVRQKRRLEQLEGRIRVIQDCEVSAELAKHSMSKFEGHWEFDLVREGRLRHYLGEDVIGLGMAWGENAMTGQGIWPRFGHNFRSFSFLVDAERQLTGGSFYNANELIAVIVGVACPEKSDAIEEWPSLDLAAKPKVDYQGTTYRYNMQGESITETAYQSIDFPNSITKSYGCYTESLSFSSTGQAIETQTFVETQSVILRRYYEAGIPQSIEISWLA